MKKRSINVHQAIAPFCNRYIAHRGLFNNEKGIPENSIMAFKRAAQKGYAIELDVQLTKDGKMVVFHDDDLKRMCGSLWRVKELTFSELKKYRLINTEERIPLLSEVLRVVDGKVPLLIEIKARNREIKTTRTLDYLVKNYKGVYCIESFSPRVVGWYRYNRPDVVRGQLLPGINKKHIILSWFQQLFLPTLIANIYAKPDFLAYNHKMAGLISYRICRMLYRGYNAGWTIKSKEELIKSKKYFDMFICDSFMI